MMDSLIFLPQQIFQPSHDQSFNNLLTRCNSSPRQYWEINKQKKIHFTKS